MNENNPRYDIEFGYDQDDDQWCKTCQGTQSSIGVFGQGDPCPMCNGTGLAGVAVTELTPEMTGVWEITTQGSIHIWNLDEGWYMRLPQRTAQHRSMLGFQNQRKIHWISVRTWPKVGERFHVTLHGDIPWHMSSTIKSIKEKRDT